jgi:hypothetical protein
VTPPETVSPVKPSLLRDWLHALRYWLRGRNGVIALVVLAVVIGGALNWSWVVAIGIAPLLITVLPCAAMCALGLCMNRMGGRSCSTEASSVETPRPDARVIGSLEVGGPAPIPPRSDGSRPPDELTASLATPVTAHPNRSKDHE